MRAIECKYSVLTITILMYVVYAQRKHRLRYAEKQAPLKADQVSTKSWEMLTADFLQYKK
jgi:hypothetical protein